MLLENKNAVSYGVGGAIGGGGGTRQDRNGGAAR
jgi:hypothetical protein